jgi:Protein of unknown function (DUF4236)
MGWGFRKSIGFGPFRLNFSKSGIGASVGVRGARVGINSRGQAYTQAGLGGLYYRQQSSNLFKKRAVNREVGARLAAGSERDYDSFALPLRFPAAVVQEIQTLVANASNPVERTDDGVTIRLHDEFSMSIQVVPMDQGSEVRFFLWRHNEDGTMQLVGFEGELGAQALACISPIRDHLMNELGGVPLERPPVEAYSSGQQETWSKRRLIALIVFCGIIVYCFAFIYYAAKPRPQPTTQITTPTPAPSTTNAAKPPIKEGRIKNRKSKKQIQ